MRQLAAPACNRSPITVPVSFMGDDLFAVRIDRWLLATRMFKTRADAQQACIGGKIKLNDNTVKPSNIVKRGDCVEAESPRGHLIWDVVELADRRLSAPMARQLYDDRSPPPPPKEERIAPRERGAGRPTKADRRATERFRGGD